MSQPIRYEPRLEEQSSREDVNIQALLQKISIKAMRSAETVLDEDMLQSLQKKYEETLSQDQNGVEFVEFMIYSMLNYIDRLQQSFEVDVVKQDYTALEEAVQKSEAEIRKHIRIQQQLKIYLDTLQDKVEDAEKKMALQQMKYAQLFESMKEIDEERKELQKKLMKIDEGRGKVDEKGKSSSYATVNEQIYKDYFGGRKVKVNKGRHVIDKISQKSRKLSSNQKSGSNLHFVQGSIQINLSNNIVVNKKGSYDQHLTKKQPPSHNSSIRELTKTVNMKHPHLQGIERRPRKVSKYKTESGQQIDKKEGRSNSVCN